MDLIGFTDKCFLPLPDRLRLLRFIEEFWKTWTLESSSLRSVIIFEIRIFPINQSPLPSLILTLTLKLSCVDMNTRLWWVPENFENIGCIDVNTRVRWVPIEFGYSPQCTKSLDGRYDGREMELVDWEYPNLRYYDISLRLLALGSRKGPSFLNFVAKSNSPRCQILSLFYSNELLIILPIDF